MYRRTYAEINLDHLAHNIRLIQKAFPQAFLCPMVKANAYGHGDVQLSRSLEAMGVQHLGVCLIEEALLLREAGVKTEILVFRGFDREGAQKMVDYKLTPVVSSWEQIEHLEKINRGLIPIHLKFDTGMNRLGFRADEAEALAQRLWQNKNIQLQALLTHLWMGEDADQDRGHSARQLQTFQKVNEVFKPFQIFAHALNSAGILNKMFLQQQNRLSPSHPLAQEWGLRPGLMIYGYNPLTDKKNLPLKPVMSLKSHASVYRHLAVGETLSYGGTWKAQRPSVIAVVPIGYADGYHRILSNQAYALFEGVKVPVVGNICMDYLMLDVTDIGHVNEISQRQDQKEAEVVLFGESAQGTFLSAEELAVQARTITWEMLTSVGERVPRVYLQSTGGQ